MRILIIDDEENIRSTLSVMLRGLGHDVVSAEDAPSALREVEKAQFDVAFLDLKLNGESGLEVLPELLRNNAHLDVVAFTAYASIESAVEAMRRGAAEYLSKPFTPEQIRQVLRKLGKTRQLEGRVASLESRLTSDSPPPSVETIEPAMERAFHLAFKRPPHRPPCCCWARVAPAKASWPAPSTNAARKRTRRSSPSVARVCPPNCCRANYSGASRAPTPGPQ